MFKEFGVFCCPLPLPPSLVCSSKSYRSQTRRARERGSKRCCAICLSFPLCLAPLPRTLPRVSSAGPWLFRKPWPLPWPRGQKKKKIGMGPLRPAAPAGFWNIMVLCLSLALCDKRSILTALWWQAVPVPPATLLLCRREDTAVTGKASLLWLKVFFLILSDSKSFVFYKHLLLSSDHCYLARSAAAANTTLIAVPKHCAIHIIKYAVRHSRLHSQEGTCSVWLGRTAKHPAVGNHDG